MELLGWDIHNQQGRAPAYHDVIEKNPVKMGGSPGALDYGFYTAREWRFFLEAKKPSVNIADRRVMSHIVAKKIASEVLCSFMELLGT